MTSSRKATVKWNIPSPELDDDSDSDRYEYSDTFIDDRSTFQNYSDTFISESYSDTFVNPTSRTSLTKDIKGGDGSDTENIRTVISFRTSFDESEIQDATYLETAQTGMLETVMEVDSDLTSTGVSETMKTYDRSSSYDHTDTQPPDTYSDTFEASDRVHVDSQVDTMGDKSSIQSSETDSTATRTYSGYSFEDDNLLDRSYIAPDYDGKALTDDDDTQADETYSEDYSYTFEPTDTTSYVTQDPEKARYEAEQINIGEQAQKDFVKSLIQRLQSKQSKPTKSYGTLERLPTKPHEVKQDDYLKHFCKKKVKLLKKRKLLDKETESEQNSELTGVSKDQQFSSSELRDYGLPDSVLERAKIKNIMSAMKRAAQEEIHEPKKCPQCRELKSQLDYEDAERKFVTAQARKLKNKIMDARVEDHLLKMNSISMIAELARELPRHSEKPEKVLDKLFEPLLGKNVMR